MFDTLGIFLYTDFMITLARQIKLKIKKFDELMIKRIQKREREINRYIFEILRPKPKGKK